MPFGHERLDVYQLSLEYVAWAFSLCQRLTGIRPHARDQLLRASQSIPLHIAEGNGKATGADRRRFFEIARSSALECAAIQDVLEVCQAITFQQSLQAKTPLDRIVAMLTKMGRRGYSVQEETGRYRLLGSR